ncbi:hypothetical protein OF83DRAFT_776096 [Amylostereum chailletii]|nr:hypothetical protein OF83DRAFT_776096 [Amylostereum chailletii]
MLGVHSTRGENATAVAVAPVMVQRPRSVAVPRRGKTLESMLIVAADRAFAEEQANRMVVDEDEDRAHAEAGPSRREEKTPAIAGEYYSVRWEDQKLTPRVTRPKVTISTSGWTNGRTAAGDADVTRPPAAYSPEDYKSPSELWRSTTTPAVPSPLQANLNPRSRTDSTRAPVVLSWTRMNDEHSVSDDESVRDGAGARALRRDSISRAAIVRSVHAGVPASVLGISAPGSARRRSNQVAA